MFTKPGTYVIDVEGFGKNAMASLRARR
ncbi:hypothetical protein [Trueperella bonasi]